MISDKEIVENMDKKEKFKTICKIKKINYEKIIENLIKRIQDSDIEDKDTYIGCHEIWDEEYFNVIQELTVLYITDDLLYSKIWIETTDKEKEVIKIAKECKLDEIKVEIM